MRIRIHRPVSKSSTPINTTLVAKQQKKQPVNRPKLDAPDPKFNFDLSKIPISSPNRSSSTINSKSGNKSLQTKLTIGQLEDKYEQKADRGAAQVVQQMNEPPTQKSDSGRTLQREEITKEKKQPEEVQTKPIVTHIHRQEKSSQEEEEENQAQMKPMIRSVQSNQNLQRKARILEPESEEIIVENLPVTAQEVHDWEIELNGKIGNQVPSRINSFAHLITSTLHNYALWLSNNDPDMDIDLTMFDFIVDTAFTIASFYLKIPKGALGEVVKIGMNSIKEGFKQGVAGVLETDGSWKAAAQKLTKGVVDELIVDMIQADWVNDFPGWLKSNIPEEYAQVHRDYRERKLNHNYDPSLIHSEINRWLTRLGVPDPRNKLVRRQLLTHLISETKFAQVRERATRLLYRILPGATTGDERLYWKSQRKLRSRLHFEATKEAYKLIKEDKSKGKENR